MSERISFTVIGISDSRTPELPAEAREAISAAKMFAGGKRHRDIMSPYLPAGAEWIDITVPLAEPIARLKDCGEAVVFASGDPLFFGLAATLQREIPEAEIRVIPWFNSLQTLAHRMNLPYAAMRCVSLTGRPWEEFDRALIECAELIGVLTDRVHTPAAIASRMIEFGYTGYTAMLGENLGNTETERTASMTLEELSSTDARLPNCVIFKKTSDRHTRFGIPEEEFTGLPGRPNMITKMPFRLIALAMLGLERRTSLWDIGFCTGSVSIEARLRFPHLNVTAFERRQECGDIMAENARRFGTPGITAITGDFMDLDLDIYPRPDAVFIGGHGGKMKEMVARIRHYLLPGGVIVFNSVSPESRDMFTEAIAAAGMSLTGCHTVTLDSHNPITILKTQ